MDRPTRGDRAGGRDRESVTRTVLLVLVDTDVLRRVVVIGERIRVLAVVGVPPLMLMLAAIAGNMLQHRLVWSGESLKPKFSKLSPAAGFKRIFGAQGIANFLKGLAKIAIVGSGSGPCSTMTPF